MYENRVAFKYRIILSNVCRTLFIIILLKHIDSNSRQWYYINIANNKKKIRERRK